MIDVLKTGSKELGIELEAKQINELCRYAKLLVEWNKKINLTAITDDISIATKHFLDSMSAITTGYVNGNIIDVGCGAGFPGLVLKIVKPGLQLTLLDSLNKRINFLNEVISDLKIDGVQTVHARAEDGARQISELCIPFLKIDGRFLALKGPLADDELKDANRAIHILGGEVEEIKGIHIPHTDLNHKIIIVRKVRHTPIQYPRKAGIVTKNPIDSCYNIKQIKKKK